jgi:ABC-type multidrug transport system fused ATPase/permease subunit
MYEGALEVFHGALDIGSLTSFVFYTLYMAFAMTIMSNLYTDLMSALGASER